MTGPREPRTTEPGGFEPPEETTDRNEPNPELLASLKDEKENDGERITVRRKIVLGPDGVPQVLEDEEVEQTTRRVILAPPDEK